MTVVAFLPDNDSETASRVEKFAADRDYMIDHRVSDLEEAKHLLRKGDVLLMHSVLDFDADGMKGLNTVVDFTDHRGVTVVSVRENYVLKDDTMSHLLAGVCYLTQAMSQSYDGDKR